MNEGSSGRQGLIREQLPSFEGQSASEVVRSDAGEVGRWRHRQVETSVPLRSEHLAGNCTSGKASPQVLLRGEIISSPSTEFPAHQSSPGTVAIAHRGKPPPPKKTAGQQFFTLTCIKTEVRAKVL